MVVLTTDRPLRPFAMCNATPFLTGCATIPEFNAGRISICTTDATSFTAGCNNAEYAGTDDAQASFAADCAANTATGCDTTYINGGSDGPTVAMCNTTPFADGCVANSAFETGRMSVCTTDATSFHASCVEATYTGTDDARISFAEGCADGSVTTGCDTTYINGGTDGSTVEACNANPFLTDCATNGAFASAQTALTELCVATNDPFNTKCANITNNPDFADNNDVARDTYCQNTALPAAGDTGEHCADRKAEICVTVGATATYNPFAPLCRDDSAIATARDTFCQAITSAGGPANPNCSIVEADLCAANPFGTKLGTAATVDCTAGTYDGNRKALVDACRNGDTLPSGATCTVAINNCNANPFNPTAFSGEACDPAAFADAQVAYCVKSENAWHADCGTLADASSGAGTVKQARYDICLDNGAIMTGTEANDVAAGASLFDTLCAGATAVDGTTRTIAIEQMAYCVKSDNAWNANCNTLADASSGADTVKQARNDICLNNGAIMTGTEANDVAAGASLFDTLCAGATSVDGTTRTIAIEQMAYCVKSDNAWNANCNTLADASSGADTVKQARNDICLDNGAIMTGTEANDVAAGASLFDTLCAGATSVDGTTRTILIEQVAHCSEPENAWLGVCDPLTGSNSGILTARADVCVDNKEINNGQGFKIAAGQSLFNTTFCAEDATNSKGTTVETARTEWCTAAGDNDDNIFDVQCGALDRSGTAIAGTLDARLAACQNSLVSLGPKAPVNACVAESTMICGTAEPQGLPPSLPFAHLCHGILQLAPILSPPSKHFVVWMRLIMGWKFALIR